MLATILSILHLVLIIYAVLNIAGSRSPNLHKALWIVLVVLAPYVGFIIWFLLGPRG